MGSGFHTIYFLLVIQTIQSPKSFLMFLIPTDLGVWSPGCKSSFCYWAILGKSFNGLGSLSHTLQMRILDWMASHIPFTPILYYREPLSVCCEWLELGCYQGAKADAQGSGFIRGRLCVMKCPRSCLLRLTILITKLKSDTECSW